MIKKYLLPIGFLAFAVIALALPVFAKEGGNANANANANVNANAGGGAYGIENREKVRNRIEAHKASTTENRIERQEMIRSRIELRKASSTERRIEMQTSLAERKVDHTARIIMATIDRLERIMVRIESRAEKIRGLGENTTETENFVALARENLVDALAAVDAFADLDLSGDNAQENFRTIRAAAAEAKECIRNAHRNMMMAVRALKGPNTGLEVGSVATSTATTTPDSDD